jgi:hypothetical protein
MLLFIAIFIFIVSPFIFINLALLYLTFIHLFILLANLIRPSTLQLIVILKGACTITLKNIDKPKFNKEYFLKF